MKLKFIILSLIVHFISFGQTYTPLVNAFVSPYNGSTNALRLLGGITVLSDGKIVVANRGGLTPSPGIGNTVNILTLNGSNIGAFASFGSLGTLTGQFTAPFGICVDSQDKIYTTELFGNRIQILTISGSTVGVFNTLPISVTGGIYISQNGTMYTMQSSFIEVWTPNGNNFTKIGTIGTNNVGSGNNEFNYPYGVSVGINGYIYIADMINSRVQVWTQSGSNFGYFATMGVTTVSGFTNDKFRSPYSVSVHGNYIYVADLSNNRVQVWTQSGSNFGYFATIGAGSFGVANNEFKAPTGVYAGSNGLIYVSERDGGRVSVWTTNTLIGVNTGTGTNTTTGISTLNQDAKQPINISPNPTDGIINLLNSKTIRVIVYNIMGVAVFEKVILPNSQLDISHLPSGLYLLKDNESGFVGKVYKE